MSRRQKVREVAERVAKEIRASYPDYEVEVVLGKTPTGGDASVWITAPREEITDISSSASDVAAMAWEKTGIFIVPRFQPKESSTLGVKSRPSKRANIQEEP